MEINEIWTYNHDYPILSLEIGNINGNDEISLIATTKNGEILLFTLQGELILKDLISENQPIWHARLFDKDGVGRQKLIMGGMDGCLRAFRYDSLNKLEIMWTHQFSSSISGIMFEDVNDNGQKEVIAYSLDKTLRILNANDGNLIWGQIFEDGIGDAHLYRNNENLNEKQIIACGNDGTIRNFNIKNGELKWFKRYSNKMRCVSSFDSINEKIIATGGDDKVLRFINSKDHEEIKTFEFKDYVWKLKPFSIDKSDKLIVSTYSFDYLNDTSSLNGLAFTSKLMYINHYLEILWEINNINVESLETFELKKKMYILVGTTKGTVILVDSSSGKILAEIKKHSCSNSVKYWSERQLIFSCHDDGSLYSFQLNTL